jgi:molybdenum cofactor biosynthesis protein B
MGLKEHRATAPRKLKVGVFSMSSTRSLADDKAGHWIRKRALKEGHEVLVHQVIDDIAGSISSAVLECIYEQQPHVILMTGGTGVSAKDVTIEAVRPLFDKELTAFSVLFAQLSYEQIDSAAIMSRATAGIIQKTAVFCLPGSLKACKLACQALIFPELGHIVRHLQKG